MFTATAAAQVHFEMCPLAIFIAYSIGRVSCIVRFVRMFYKKKKYELKLYETFVTAAPPLAVFCRL